MGVDVHVPAWCTAGDGVTAGAAAMVRNVTFKQDGTVTSLAGYPR
jgi:hypothetical protein